MLYSAINCHAKIKSKNTGRKEDKENFYKKVKSSESEGTEGREEIQLKRRNTSFNS